MISAYDMPATYKYIDTTPLAEMNMVGEAYKDFYNNALKNYQAYATTYGDFTSPISSDVEGYNNETTNRLKTGIAEINDPDWLKTSEGQSMISNLIANTDYAKLAKYRQSAQNANEWLKAYQNLKAQGKINDNWIDVSPNTWSTDKNGIFNETSPIEYKSAAELTNEYTNNLKPSLLGSKMINGGRYNLFGVSENAIRNSVADHFNDLIQSPQGKKYYEQSVKTALAINPTLSGNNLDKVARGIFDQTMVDANKDKIYVNPEIDQNWLENKRFAEKAELQRQSMMYNAALKGLTGQNPSTGDRHLSNMIKYDSTGNDSTNLYNFANFMANLSKSNSPYSNKPFVYGNIKFNSPAHAAKNYQIYVNAQKEYSESNNPVIRARAKEIIQKYYPTLSRAANAWTLVTNARVQSKAEGAMLKSNNITSDNAGEFANAASNAISSSFGVNMNENYKSYINKNAYDIDSKTGMGQAATGTYVSPETLYSKLTGRTTRITRQNGNGKNVTNSIDNNEMAGIPGAMFKPSSSKVIALPSAKSNSGQVAYTEGNILIPANQIRNYGLFYGTEDERAFPSVMRRRSIFGNPKDKTINKQESDRLKRKIGGTACYVNGEPYIAFKAFRQLYDDDNSRKSLDLNYDKWVAGSSFAKQDYQSATDYSDIDAE